MSRSSSVSAKDKSAQGKRKPAKQRRDDSESFDVRSQYTPFFPQQQIPPWTPTSQYSPMGPQQFSGAVQNNFQNPMPQHFGPPSQQYPAPMMNPGNMQPYNSMPQVWSLPAQDQEFQTDDSLLVLSTKSVPISTTT